MPFGTGPSRRAISPVEERARRSEAGSARAVDSGLPSLEVKTRAGPPSQDAP
jgi:hypothetical protein